MRSFNLYSDLECTNLVTQIVTQDYILPEGKQLYTRIDGYGNTSPDAFSWTVSQLPEPVVYTARYVAEGTSPDEQTGSFMSQPVIADSTVAFPLGEPGTEPEIKSFYIEGGVRLDWDYYYDSQNDGLKIALWAPKYFTGWSEDNEPQPQFDSIWIKTGQGSNILWVNKLNTENEATYFTVEQASNYSNIQLIVVEGEVYFKKTTAPTFGNFERAFIPVVMAIHNGELECLNGYVPQGFARFPSAISINCFKSDEIIPEPEGEETNEGNNVLQDGQGAGIGVSDDAADIDVNTLNHSTLAWGGRGSGLSYYVMPRASFSYVIRQLWNNFYKDPETVLRDIIGTFIFNEENLSTTIDLDAIRQCLLAAFACPFYPQSTTTANATCWIGPYGATAPDAAYVALRYSEVANISLSSVRPDFENDGFGDFSDFNNCTASLHLPFVGDISVDITTVARGDIRVKAIFDFYTGNIVYLVYTRSMQAPQGKEILYGVYNGNAAVEIPIMAIGSNSNILGRILNSGTAMATGVMSAIGGNVSAIPSIVQSDFAMNQAKNDMSVVNRGGLIDHNSGPLQTLDITLQIRRARELKPENRRDIEGIESVTKSKIGNFSGFIKVKSCDLKGLKCQDSEVRQIEAMLMEGVYV